MNQSTERKLRDIITREDNKLYKVECYISILSDPKQDVQWGKDKTLSNYRIARARILKRRNRLLTWFDYLCPEVEGEEDYEL